MGMNYLYNDFDDSILEVFHLSACYLLSAYLPDDLFSTI